MTLVHADGTRATKFAILVSFGVVALGCSAGSDDAPDAVRPVTGAHSPIEGPLVDPAEIISGGVAPDGIPPIDDPRFLDPAEVSFLSPQEPVVAVQVNGIAKAYPIRILMWHEIVNDDFEGVPVLITYCPLCNSGIAFHRPTIDGELLDFGTSGKLYRSNLVMYDRQTNSYWPQALGQAVVGPLIGEVLEPVPARLLSWADWRRSHPDGLVLSTRTGHRRERLQSLRRV